jgi:XisI protein
MDRIAILQQAIVSVMDDYIAEHAHSESLQGLQYEKVIDAQNLHFQLILLGWKERQRIFNLIFHVDIIGDKIWIQEDNLEYSVAERLTEKGISKKEIVLAYFTTAHRQYTEYAVS